MSLLDLFTGGKAGEAGDALRRAEGAYSSIQAPTAGQLTLPELQKYVQAGLMTPAEAQAYLQESNAYATQNIPQTGTAAMQQALGQLSDISDAGPMGTPTMQAQSANTVQQLNNAVQGQRGAIEQQMQAKGTPAAMIQAALANQYQGQDAQQAYHNSLDQQAAAYQAAVQALSEKANVGGALQGQQNQQANTVSGAQNAMQQFNAANQQQNSQYNAANKQQAGAANLQNAQNVANQNTGLANQRTQYNAQVPEQTFQDAIQKAGGQAAVNANQANLFQQQGEQNAGIYSGLIGSGATMMGAPPGIVQQPKSNLPKVAHGGVISDHAGCYHDGGICMEGGGMVPGQAEVGGDSLQNDNVQANLSPGEAVIPRTAVQENMPEVLGLISGGGAPQSDPRDIASVLQALRQLRMGAA